MNDIIRFTNDIAQTWIPVPEGHAEELVEYIAKAAENLNGTAPDAKVFKAGQVPLEELPEDVQQKVRGTLKAFDVCHVEYEHGAFHAGTCVCLQATYPTDHFVAGSYKAKDVYTPEERRQNFIEEFGYAPCH